MPGADVALGVGVHVEVAGVPEEEDVLFCSGWRRVQDGVVDEGVGTEIEEVVGDGEDSGWEGVVVGIHCEL